MPIIVVKYTIKFKLRHRNPVYSVQGKNFIYNIIRPVKLS